MPFNLDTFVLISDDLDVNDYFGYSVSVSGTSGNAVAIISAVYDDGFDNSKIDAGAVHTYRDTGAGWVKDLIVLRPDDLDANDYFGISVSISGTPGAAVAIVGAVYDDGLDNGKTNAGAAYTYRDTGTGWTQDGILRPNDLDAEDAFGRSVSISGTPGNAVAIVGAYGNDGLNNDQESAGAAYTYRDVNGNGWVQDPVVLRPDELETSDFFGHDVSISGTPGNAVAIIGAPFDDGENYDKINAGAAYTYRDTGTGWVKDSVILRPIELDADDYFGYVVSISGTPGAAVAIVGAQRDNGLDNGKGHAGAAYTYRDTGANWIQDVILRPNDLDVNDYFGRFVSISGTPGHAVAIVGSPGDDGVDNGKENAGAAYTYRDTGTGWIQDPVVLRADNLDANDFFGPSVSISSTPGNAVAIVGAFNNNAGGVSYTYREVDYIIQLDTLTQTITASGTLDINLSSTPTSSTTIHATSNVDHLQFSPLNLSFTDTTPQQLTMTRRIPSLITDVGSAGIYGALSIMMGDSSTAIVTIAYNSGDFNYSSASATHMVTFEPVPTDVRQFINWYDENYAE